MPIYCSPPEPHQTFYRRRSEFRRFAVCTGKKHWCNSFTFKFYRLHFSSFFLQLQQNSKYAHFLQNGIFLNFISFLVVIADSPMLIPSSADYDNADWNRYEGRICRMNLHHNSCSPANSVRYPKLC